mgnify:CR=1 FL=1
MTKKKILIATGGTGGHVFPAYSLAKYLIDKKFNIKLTTDIRGSQYLKNYENLNLAIIPSSPLARKSFLKFIFSILIIIFSIIKSVLFLILNRPSLILAWAGIHLFRYALLHFF